MTKRSDERVSAYGASSKRSGRRFVLQKLFHVGRPIERQEVPELPGVVRRSGLERVKPLLLLFHGKLHGVVEERLG